MSAAGIRPALATPTLFTVVVTSEQGLEHHPIHEEMLTAAAQGRYGIWSMCRDLTEAVQDWRRHEPQGRGSVRYTAAYVRELQEPKATVEVVEGKQDIWDRHGTRRFRKEFPDTAPGAQLLAGE